MYVLDTGARVAGPRKKHIEDALDVALSPNGTLYALSADESA